MSFNYDPFVIYLKLIVLLYADDTVIFGTDEKCFQENLDHFYDFAESWKLDINFSKTKVMTFGTRNDEHREFKLGNEIIEICKEFKYLGVTFSKTRSFYKTMKNNVTQAKKAMHLLYKRIRNLNLPIDLQLKLFDHTIVPILLNGCEVWGYQNTQIIENVQNDLLRKMLNLRKSTPIYILLAEFGRRPLQINIKCRMINYWISVVNGKPSKLSKVLYTILLNEKNIGRYEHNWIRCINNILISVGKIDLLKSDKIDNPHALKASIKRTLTDLYIQEWHGKLNDSSKGKTYSLFKHDISLESYLVDLPRKHYIHLCKFRTANHRLPVETGRWENVPIHERLCNICNDDIGDEFHYLFKCKSFDNERKLYLKPYSYNRPNIPKFVDLMSSQNTIVLTKLSKFVRIIMERIA